MSFMRRRISTGRCVSRHQQLLDVVLGRDDPLQSHKKLAVPSKKKSAILRVSLSAAAKMNLENLIV